MKFQAMFSESGHQFVILGDKTHEVLSPISGKNIYSLGM